MSDQEAKPSTMTDFILEHSGKFGIGVGVIILLLTVVVQSYTIDSGSATTLHTMTITSGYFYAWLASLGVLYLVGLFILRSNLTSENTYVMLLYFILLTFIMSHLSIYLSLNQVQVSQ
jgi:hypothetical protein